MSPSLYCSAMIAAHPVDEVRQIIAEIELGRFLHEHAGIEETHRPRLIEFAATVKMPDRGRRTTGRLGFIYCIYNRCIIIYYAKKERVTIAADAPGGTGRNAMDFGYFTLSDNHYQDNPRGANQFVPDITAEALYADELGMHSAWIGEHHFNSLGVLSCPDLVLSLCRSRTPNYSAGARRHGAAAASSHPRRRAMGDARLLSNGRVDFACRRGYDQREYLPFHVSFADNQAIFEEGLELVRRLWAAEDRISHHGKHYSFDDVRITPKPVQKPLPTYVGSFSKPSIELAARLDCGLIVAPFAAAMSYGGLKQVADLYHETCAKHGTKPNRLMCSYFIHFADDKAQEDAQRARQIRYYKECVIPAFPGDPKTAPPSYRYFIDMVDRLQKVRPEDLTENSVLLGSSRASSTR